MRRILLMLAIAVLMVVMVVATATPSFAKPHKTHGCSQGSTGFKHSNGKCFHSV